MKSRIFVLGLMMLALTMVGRVGAADAPAAKFGALAAGVAAPDFKVVGADKTEIKLSDFRGKTVILNFWAPNRGPADALEGPALMYADAGVVVLGVAVGAARTDFDKWVAQAKNKISYRLAWDPAGANAAEGIAKKLFGVGSLPATGVIDKDGKVVAGFTGFGPQVQPMLRTALRQAGAAIAPDPAPEVATAPPPAPAGSVPGGGNGGRPEEVNLIKLGTVAPEFSARDAAGKEVKLSAFAGKIVVIDFWATWCAPCLAAMPQTQQLAAAAKADVVVLAACTSDTRANFEAWVKDNAAKYPDIIFANDPNGKDTPATFEERVSKKLYGVTGLPTRVIVGRDGKVAEIVVGHGEGDPRLRAALEALGVKFGP